MPGNSNIQLLDSNKIAHEGNSFESKYIALRKYENRVVSNTELLALPETAYTHPYHTEWLIRRKSATKLKEYLRNKKRPLNILEIGCGNGWLSSLLAKISEANVIGTDINSIELQQAKTVFGNQSNLDFIEGDIREGLFKEPEFDIIVFAASIQYFSPIKEILQSVFTLLSTNGEIHIIDSHFYNKEELENARLNSRLYFTTAGFPEMIPHYFHHSWEDLKNYKYKLLYNPASILNKFKSLRNPFPWVSITH
jgi:ubiquinone/menaquinone biosynthesis C-methylase UbiE